MKTFERFFPWIVTLLAAVWIFSSLRLPQDPAGEMKIREFGRLPLVHEGRVKPFDSLARQALRTVSGGESFRIDNREQPAIRWFLDVVAKPEEAGKHEVVRIPYREIQQALKLDQNRKGFRYSFAEIQKQMMELHQQQHPGEDSFEIRLNEILRKLDLYWSLSEPHSLPSVSRENLPKLRVRLDQMKKHPMPLAVPPSGNGKEWKSLHEAWLEDWESELEETKRAGNSAARHLVSLFTAYQAGDAAKFNRSLEEYEAWLREHPPGDVSPAKLSTELRYNQSRPLLLCASLFVLAFVFCALSWAGWSQPLERAAGHVIAIGFVALTVTLTARIYVSGRPPVTNLHSSAIFIGWGAVLFGMILERVHRNGVGRVVAAVSGFLTLLIAYNLAQGSDTFQVLQAVLDTNFWLATHVTSITLGYATTFFAGFVGILFVVRALFTRGLTPQSRQELGRMMYGMICFALFFSFVGTVLGGLWADDSWGRFWGWDPKENGALLIVLWNGLILHARWGGMVKARGIAVLSIFGNIVTAWSWFGTNLLDVGLHSYGRTEEGVRWMIYFVLSQLLLIGLGLLPERWGRSAPAPTAPQPE